VRREHRLGFVCIAERRDGGALTVADCRDDGALSLTYRGDDGALSVSQPLEGAAHFWGSARTLLDQFLSRTLKLASDVRKPI
jgi:hypothetical protein